MAYLEAKNIFFKYPDSEQHVLKNVSFSTSRGEFIVLCGPSGSGKSTLLRLIKREIAPHGKQDGIFQLDGKLLEHTSEETAKDIGMVFQDPENQIVMDQVLEELIFGMENLGYSTDEMRKKIAEIVHFFGLGDLLHRKTHELSGGQKQLVNLASILVLEPKLLLLDEPTAQLDPVAARDFIGMLQTMNDEFGITIIIAEHRLEELFGIADKAIVLVDGEISIQGNPRDVIATIGKDDKHPLYPYLPSPARLYLEHEINTNHPHIPINVKEGKSWLLKQQVELLANIEEEITTSAELVKLKNIEFQYSRESTKILDRLSLSILKGEWLSIVGANGTGKSTLLKVIAGLEKPQHGSIYYEKKKLKKHNPGKIGYLPQNPKLFFIQDTIEAELKQIAKFHQLQTGDEEINYYVKLFQLEDILQQHPYDVSGGQMQKAALAGVLLSKPSLLLVDEPTKGLDPVAKQTFGELLKMLQKQGLTIVMVTHDIEFAAKYATRCAMLFQGTITTIAPAKRFFNGNAFYTTVLNRITRGSDIPHVLTVEEARM
ncbi:ABC transporter ATP-binding protein [Metabacillus malikii]|uniref:Energy-coupling factor transport system ATP-binding protein n=1 Tax=Metabacillus malikii TaxID=1504265 RepID=A0ABT9ZBI8_9BACI|nr:ABC transporter ATP-binding protein [Metabacillus malikii]MDQ0229629.1 energy-coupling factor transport system ATP-binding protein [Metabacillus malikii]